MPSRPRGAAIPLLALVLSFLVVLAVGRWTAPARPPEPQVPPVVAVGPPVGPADPAVREVEIIGGAVEADSAWQPFPGVTMSFVVGGTEQRMMACLNAGVHNWMIADADPVTRCAPLDTSEPHRTVVKLVRP